MKNVLVTGGAGFIGSNFIRLILNEKPDVKVYNYDKLTYAGNLENLSDVEDNSNYTFIKGDICDYKKVRQSIFDYNIDTVINFAAETHVDRSIMENAVDFIRTDVEGVYVLLEVCKEKGIELFIQISTDEVYGSVESGFSKETDQLIPRNPYAASKTGGDRLAYSFFTTYNMPIIITRASNNYGPYQYPEKLIPLFITNVTDDISVPLYGDGMNIRDWLYVEDHCRAILFLTENGKFGEVYNIGGGNLHPNVEITKTILKLCKKPESLIKPVKDRLGHDRRYALDSTKLSELGFKTQMSFEEGMIKTVEWYQKNENWWRKLKDSDYKEYYDKQYKKR